MTSNNGGNIISPCIKQCALDEQEMCRGCYRTISEIIGWSEASDEQKKQILVNCTRRNQAQAVS